MVTFDFALSKRGAHGYAGKGVNTPKDTERSYFLLRNTGGENRGANYLLLVPIPLFAAVIQI